MDQKEEKILVLLQTRANSVWGVLTSKSSFTEKKPKYRNLPKSVNKFTIEEILVITVGGKQEDDFISQGL